MANNIKKLRLEAGLTQPELAKKMGIDKTTVYKHESGRLGLKGDLIRRYAKALGKQPADIISDNADSVDNIDLLEQVSIAAMNFLIKNNYLVGMNSKQIAHFIVEAYSTLNDEIQENAKFELDDSHLKLIYKQVS
jgi:DNA-binding XRE family transcriptional regulator